jgi:hypothetical protein
MPGAAPVGDADAQAVIGTIVSCQEFLDLLDGAIAKFQIQAGLWINRLHKVVLS